MSPSLRSRSISEIRYFIIHFPYLCLHKALFWPLNEAFICRLWVAESVCFFDCIMPSCRKLYILNDRIMKVGGISQHDRGKGNCLWPLIQDMFRPLNISLHINTSFIYHIGMSKVLFLLEQNTMKHRQIVDPKPSKQLILFLSNGHLRHYFSLYRAVS